MGTRIESVATSYPKHRWFGRGALHLTDAAARSCLARGHHHATELDLLVNVGLYKDHNLAEPALASIIQEDVGANVGHPPQSGHHGTFSFDVLDGGCGVVTAAQIVDGFVGNGTAKLALIVAGDADPYPRPSHNFPFAPAGGALLLRHAEDDVGFVSFLSRTFAADAGMFESATRWEPHAGVRHRGKHVLEVHEAPEFAGRCADHGIEVTRELLAAAQVTADEIDLLVTSSYPRTFASELAAGLGIDMARVPGPRLELTRAHTAGPLAALEAAHASGDLSRARYILFVTAGAGITIGAALYRDESRLRVVGGLDRLAPERHPRWR